MPYKPIRVSTDVLKKMFSFRNIFLKCFGLVSENTKTKGFICIQAPAHVHTSSAHRPMALVNLRFEKRFFISPWACVSLFCAFSILSLGLYVKIMIISAFSFHSVCRGPTTGKTHIRPDNQFYGVRKNSIEKISHIQDRIGFKMAPRSINLPYSNRIPRVRKWRII